MRIITVLFIMVLALPLWCGDLTAREIKTEGAGPLLYIDYPSEFLAFNIFIPNLTYPRSGTSHMVEHLLFGSGSGIGAGELDGRLELLGYSADAYTSYDFTCLRTVIRPKDLETVCGAFAAALAGPLFEEGELTAEKGIINDEYKGRLDSAVIVKNTILKELYGDTIFGLPLEGEDINAVTREDLLLYYELNYTPANFVFVIAGRADTKELSRILAEYFPVSKPKPLAAAPALTVKSGAVTAEHNGTFGIGCAMAPANLFGESVCCSVLSSLIYLTAKQQLKDLRYSHNTGKWTSPCILLTEDEKGREVLLRVIDEIKAGKYSDEALQAAKNLQSSDFLTRNQTSKSMTYQIGQMYILHGLKAIGDYTEYIASAGREDIAKAAEKYL